MKTKSLLNSFLTLCALTFVLFGNMKQAEAYDFYAVCSTGQTLFYNITDATNHYVEMTYPGNSSNYWGGYTQPTGDIILPSTVTYGGNNYTVTAIGDNVFIFCNGLTGSLTIPNSITSIGNNAFNSCYGFTGSLTIPNSVISIGENAFTSCTHFSGSLTIPNSVTSIGDRAFSHCSGFTGSLTISNSVTSIGEGVFSQCSGFSGSLTIPNSITSIGGSAFYGCSGFTGTLTIPNSVTTIGQYAFYQCSGFTGTLTIPNSVTSIGEWAFSHCSGFTGALILPNSLTSISMRAFSTCSGLTGSLIIPNSVTSIDYEAFHNCSGFTGSLTIGSSVTSIGDAVFENCTGFTSVTALPETPPTLGTNVFSLPTTIPVYVPCGKVSAYQSVATWNAFTNIQEYCDPLIYSINPDGVSVTVTGHVDGTAATGSLTIPETKTIDGVAYTVTKIGSNAFKGCTGLTGSLTIPNSVTEIQTGAFQNCSGFTGSLTILNSVTFIGIYAFCNCTGFTGALNIPNSVTFIGNNAFQNCSGFTGSLTIPNSVTNIGGMAFQNCTGFTGSLTIGTGVTAIAGSAFKNCTGFTQVNYNAANCADRTDGQKPFEGCTNATTLIIGNTVQRIPAWIFYECSNFTGTLTIPNSVTEIGNGAFCGCTGFSGTLTIPNSVTIIDNNAFNDCTGLTGSLTIPNSVTSIGGGAFSSCNGFNGTLTIGNSVESIGIQAFMDCAGFTGSLTLPNSVTEIGYNAFIRCSGFNGSLTIGNSLTSISHRAFKDCSGFTSITALPETPPTLGSEVFSLPTTIPVYAPCESMAAYQTASGWSGFTNYFGTCDVIIFADAHVKAICVQNWDTNGDGELSYTEAAAVATFNPENYGNTSKFYGADITSFDEMQYFTGLTSTQGAFYNCTHLASVTLPSHLTTIDESAFNGCSSLASIVLPDGITSISHSVFNGCTSLTSIDLPSGVTSLGMRAFYGCTSLTSITLPSGVNSIGNQAFYNCTGMTSLTVEALTPPNAGSQAFFFVPTAIPVHVPCSSIEAYQAASQWSSFTNYIGENCVIVFADEVVKNVCVANFDTNHDGALSYDEAAAVTTLTPSGNAIFYSNHAITTFDELQYFTGLTSIGANAFNGCTNLTSITLPNQITFIDNMAFKNCSSLTSLTIPNNVTSLGVTPFMGCVALEHLAVEEGNNIYSSPNGCNAIIETATNTLIAGCKSTVIPSEVTTIGSGAFDSCTSLTTITIPSGVASIEGYAFIGCTGLTSITMEGTTPPSVGSAAFQNVPSTISVYVPCGSLVTYLTYNNGNPWGGFTNITTIPYDNFPLVENFDNYQGTTSGAVNVLPDCWNRINTTTASNFVGYPTIFTYSSYAHSGSNFLFFMSNYNNNDDPQDQYAILPPIENVSNTVLSLYARMSDNNRNATFMVGVMSNPMDASTFIEVAEFTPSSMTYEQYTLPLSDYSGQGTYIAIRLPAASSSTMYRGVCIDDVRVSMNPHDIAVSNITYSMADLSWQGSGVCFDVRYRQKNVCEFIDTGFEGGTLPAGWTCEGPNVWTVGQGDGGDPIAPWGGSYNAKIVHRYYNAVTYLVTNSMDFSQQNNLTLYLNYLNRNRTYDADEFGVYYRIDNGDWIEIFHTTEAHNTWEFLDLQLPSGAYAANCQLGFKMVDHWGYGVCLDGMSLGNMSNPVEWTNIQCQTFNEQLTDLDAYTVYQVQVKNCEDEGEYAWQPSYPLEFTTLSDFIQFADPAVKAICVASTTGWDTNGDGELSYSEAAAVTNLNPTGNSNTSPFYNNRNITSFNELQYFTGLTSMKYAFYNCTNLISVTLPETIPSISQNAFYGCTSLTSITIPSSVHYIYDYAFFHCYGLTSITIPYGVNYIGSYVFNGCSGLTSVTIPSSVLSIGVNPFLYCSALESIVVDAGNQYYDSREGCNAIIQTSTNELVSGCKNTIIPSDITIIRYYAFYNCTGLTSITLPNSITNIYNYAFFGCTGLTSITVEATTPPALGDNVFKNVPTTTPVIVPCGYYEAYNHIGWGGFTNFIEDCNIVFADDNVKALCVANWDTNGDGELSYPEAAAVTELDNVFRNNTTITSFNELQYFTGVTSIGSNAFRNCTSLTSVIIPSGVNLIGNNPFSCCPALESITVASDNTYYDSRNNCNAVIETASNTLKIGCKTTIIPSDVTTIGPGGFDGCTSLISITIPVGVTEIGTYAFERCTGLTSITLPSGVTDIYGYAFDGCTGLTSITVEATTPPTLGNNVFNEVSTNIPVNVPCGTKATYQAASGWSVFTNFVDPCEAIVFADDNVKDICVQNWDGNGDGELSYPEAAAVTSLNEVFNGNEEITSFNELQYFTGLTSIGEDFYNCNSLESITLPNTITSISGYAFQECASLTSITIPSGVTEIGYNPFANCPALASIIVEAGNTIYDSRDNCNAIIETVSDMLITGCKNTVIPSTVNMIGLSAFQGCSDLTSFTIPSGVTLIGQFAFQSCSALASISLPSTLTSIGNYAFGYCSSLTSITIPSGVTYIGSNAFQYCTVLASISIPSTVTSIGNYAFAYCTGLTSITVERETPPSVSNTAFHNVPNTIPVYVPCGSVGAYQLHNSWQYFNNFIGEGCSQDCSLVQGWNWWAPTVAMTVEQLETGLGTNGTLINSQDGGFLRYDNGEWSGTLSEIEVGKMYKIMTSAAYTLSLQGDRPATVTVTLEPGYTWFGYTGTQATAIATALGYFVPASGDMIIGENGTATYTGGTWTGNLTELVPGHGYVYFSTYNDTRTLILQ